MSAFQCSPEHIGQLAALLTRPWGTRTNEPLLRYDADPEWTATGGAADSYSYACRILWTENALSLEARYPSNNPGIVLPTFPPAIDPLAASVTHSDFAARVIKAVRCYEYQSCEHAGWESSRARGWCEDLIGAAIRALPGFTEAPWGAPFDSARAATVRRIF